MNLSDKLCSCSYSCSSAHGYNYIFPLMLSLPLCQRLAACLPGGKPCALLLFVCRGVFQLNSRAGFLHRFRFRVTPPRGSRGNGWTHQTHLSSLLSYLAGGRWWFPFPPSNVFAFTPLCQVSTGSFLTVIFHLEQVAGWNKLMRRAACAFSPSFISRSLLFRWQTSNTSQVKSAVVRDYYLIALAGCWLRIKSQLP